MRVKDRRNQRRAIDRMACDHHSNPIDLRQTVRCKHFFRRANGHEGSVCQEGDTGGTEGSMIEVVQRDHHSQAVTLGETSDQR